MKIKQYLKDNIDEYVSIEEWIGNNHLPIFLRNSYHLYEMTVLGVNCMLIEAAGEIPSTDKIKKHIKQIKKYTNHEIVLHFKDISRYRRKSLIENSIPFVIEDGQMFLPFLGLDLKKTKENSIKEVQTFTSSAQAAFVYFLYHKEDVLNTTEFAKKMKVTQMTASRALKELYLANLLTYEIGGKTGRSKEYRRIQDPDYFIKGREFLRSPVKKIVYTKTTPSDALISGFDALANLSRMNPPEQPVMAIDKNQLKKDKIDIVNHSDLIKDMKLIKLEIWEYDPKLFSNKEHVDLLSLYASLKEETDERIEQALEEILRGEPWYTD